MIRSPLVHVLSPSPHSSVALHPLRRMTAGMQSWRRKIKKLLFHDYKRRERHTRWQICVEKNNYTILKRVCSYTYILSFKKVKNLRRWFALFNGINIPQLTGSHGHCVGLSPVEIHIQYKKQKLTSTIYYNVVYNVPYVVNILCHKYFVQ